MSMRTERLDCFSCRHQRLFKINNLRALKILSSSWFEPMPGSQSFHINILQALSGDAVPILYGTSFRVN
jgi:hypothetical protein